MGELAKISNDEVFSAEIEIPFDINIDLTKSYEVISLSIGYNVIGKYFVDKNVVFYDTYYDTDKLNASVTIELSEPPTYSGTLLEVEWFLKIEINDNVESYPFKTYPKNYSKYMELNK